MTLANVETGEVVHPLDERDARDLTERIRSTLETAWEDVVEAYQRRAWDALGYDSWNHYCTQEFGASTLKLPREDRRETIASLRDAGLSTRAIAAATGVSEATARRDLAGASNDAPRQITGTDGKTYTAKQAHDDLQASSETTWADVVTAYPHAADVPATDREGLRRGFVQLQTMTGPERVQREAALLNAIDTALLTPEELAERRANAEVRPLKCPTCRRPYGGQD